MTTALQPGAASTRQESAGTSPAIRLEEVHKTYDLGEMKVHALRGVCLEIYPGEFVAVMGASGSGKSTLMNILGCLDKPTRGHYFLDGTDVSGLSKRNWRKYGARKSDSYSSNSICWRGLRRLKTWNCPRFMRAVPAAERARRARESLERVGLADRTGHFPSQLSGGQQQRVAIARALVNRPSILLADEPTGNLDSRTSVEIMDILQRLNNEHGLTVVLVTHEPDIAQYAKRALDFRDGKMRRDVAIQNRLIAAEVLPTLPAIDEDEISALGSSGAPAAAASAAAPPVAD